MTPIAAYELSYIRKQGIGFAPGGWIDNVENLIAFASHEMGNFAYFAFDEMSNIHFLRA